MDVNNPQIQDGINSHQALVEASLVFKHGWQDAYSGIFSKDDLANLKESIWQKSLQEKGRHNLLALTNNHVIGVASFGQSRQKPDARSGELMAIYILPEFQGQGIGSLLLKKAESGLKELGFDHYYLWVLAKNRHARRFYERHGWQNAEIQQYQMILDQRVKLIQYQK